MDITPPKKLSDSARRQRDRTLQRRAYLDTYAKSRVHVDPTRPQPVPEQPAQAQVQAAPIQQQPVQPVVQQPAYTPQQQSVATNSMSTQDMAALWATTPAQQSMPVRPRQQQVVSQMQPSLPKKQKKNRLNDLKQSLKASQMAKKQERVLQKRQQAELKKAAAEQSIEAGYLSSLVQQDAVTAYDQTSSRTQDSTTTELLDESGVFSTSQSQQGGDAKVEANLRALYAKPLTEQIAASSENSASASHMRTIVASAFACGIMAVGIFTVFGNYGSQPVVAQPIGSPVIEVESATSQPQAGAPVVQKNNSDDIVPADPSHPVRIIMSSIGVNAPVQGLGTTPEGLMAVPKSYGVVGWYNKGAVPGQPGPAVLAGHYTGGNRGVFDKLRDAKDGDLITVANGRGQTFTYKVTAKNEYDKDKVPMAELFKNSVDSRLEIITCSGKWQKDNYNKRLVVTAEIVR